MSRTATAHLHGTICDAGAELRATYVEVDLDQLATNFRALRRHVAPARVMPIVKANAYGHGLWEVARHLESIGAEQLGVALLEEGILLRRHGVRLPVLVLGSLDERQIPDFLRHDLTLSASSRSALEHIDDAARRMGKRAVVHLEVDTGMERTGVAHDRAESLLDASLRLRHTTVEGIYSHLADADGADPAPTRLQLERFSRVLELYDRRGVPRPLAHLANSAAIARFPATHLDMVRPGLMLYGATPSNHVVPPAGVAPTLSWRTHVGQVKIVPPGTPVSYGWSWKAPRRTAIVTLPLGYGDGYFRSLGNRSEVLWNGRRCPVVGRVCMDAMMVDVGSGSAADADPVTLIGRDGDEAIRSEQVAAWAATIPYEVLTNINTRVPRIYLQKDRSIAETTE